MYCPRLGPGIDRDAVLAGLAKRGVGASVHWEPAVHEMPAFRDLGFTDEDLPVTARLVDRVISLPMHSRLSDADADAVVTALHEVLR
jgi:dTDP-4-amino-4,6-dideoxygalactose transaminase